MLVYHFIFNHVKKNEKKLAEEIHLLLTDSMDLLKKAGLFRREKADRTKVNGVF